jgi:mutator protein MutT
MPVFYDEAATAARRRDIVFEIRRVQAPGGVVIEIVNAVLLRDGRVLLARRSAARKAYPDLWSFPGGHVERGEGLEQALHRELREEVGIVPSEYRPLAPIVDPHVASTIYRMYAVTAWQGDPTIRDREHSELRWFSLSAAASLPDLALEAYRPLFDGLAARS